MFEKDVPGFCTEVKEACSIFNIQFMDMASKNDIRGNMKKIVIEMQGSQLLQMMMISSKADRVLLNGFKYDGKCKKYIKNLDFCEARAVFMARYRMLPVKKNFPNRWDGVKCNVCGFDDTDRHTFSCPGY